MIPLVMDFLIVMVEAGGDVKCFVVGPGHTERALNIFQNIVIWLMGKLLGWTLHYSAFFVFFEEDH